MLPPIRIAEVKKKRKKLSQKMGNFQAAFSLQQLKWNKLAVGVLHDAENLYEMR